MSTTRFYIQVTGGTIIEGSFCYLDPNEGVLYEPSEDCPASYASEAEAKEALLQYLMRADKHGRRYSVQIQQITTGTQQSLDA